MPAAEPLRLLPFDGPRPLAPSDRAVLELILAAEFSGAAVLPAAVFAGEKHVSGSGDVYVPPRGWSGDGEFDWDVLGANRFDVRAAELVAFLAAEDWRFSRPGTDGDHVVVPPED